MSIKKKLILAFIIATVLASISGILSIFNTMSVNDDYSHAMKTYGFAQGDVGKVLACFGSVNVSVHDVIGYLDESDLSAARQTFDSQVQKMDDYFANVESSIEQEDTRQKFMAAQNAWNQYYPLAQELMQLGDTTDSAAVMQVQRRLADELDPLYNTIYDSMAGVLADKVNNGNDLEVQLTRSVNISAVFTAVLTVVAIALALWMGASISRGIANPIHACARRLHDLAHGDLRSPSPDFSGKDEVGILAQSTRELVGGLNTIIADESHLLGEMARGNFNVYSSCTEQYVGDFSAVLEALRTINYHLSDTLAQISRSSEQVSAGSGQVSGAAQNLSQGSTEQAGSVESLAANIEEISGQVAVNAENARQASAKADNVGAEMEQSNQKMREMIGAMGEISNSSDEIGKILKTIEDIAFQTNILALNAAVEAARAGAAGKGFAVVADEVRNLANKSQEASKNTAVLIESSVRAVENGTHIAGETAQALKTAVEGVREVVDFVDRISKASSEQSDSLTQITRNVDQISQVVQTNSATAEESAAASEELSTQAQLLNRLTSEFQLKSADAVAKYLRESAAAR